MNASFYRKVVYASIIALLWLPLYLIGRPPERNAEGEITGGKLADLRREYDLSQAELGDIDPTSESMKLATLGMRGVAVNVLWTMANHYKKVEDFDNFAATVNQITLLAPNFVSVWEFQAHNETYNVSVEYDHYRMRYAWVKKGIDLLIRGTEYNRKDTRLLNYLSWFFGQKIGRADEKKQFRELFRNDADYHAKLNEKMDMDDPDILGPVAGSTVSTASGQKVGDEKKLPDNWLVGRKWQQRAVNLVETRGVPIRGKSPVLFYSDAPMMKINFCKAIEEEGTLGSVAGSSWKSAGKEWDEYGKTPVATSWGHDIRLIEMEDYMQKLSDATDELDTKVAPGVREKILERKRQALRPEERAAIDTPIEKRNNEQMQLAYESEPKIKVIADDVANEAPEANRRRAKQLARQIADYNDQISKIDRYRGIVNYAYWRTRCELEQSDEALAGRQYIRDAEKLFAEAELEGSKEAYEKAWKEWEKVYKKHPEMMSDTEAEELVDAIKRYKIVLTQLEFKNLPAEFPLFDLLEAQNEQALIGPNRNASIEKPATEGEADKQANPESKPDEKPADKPDEPQAEEKQDDAEVKPAAEKPAETKPAEDKPQSEQPAAEEKPMDDKPAAPEEKKSDE